MNCTDTRTSWFRVRLTLGSEGRLRQYGTLTGRGVPHMLVSLRDRMPLAPQDTETVRTASDTPEGWSYETDTMTVHTHHAPAWTWLPHFRCPEPSEGGKS